MIEILSGYNLTVGNAAYFDFLSDFIRAHYGNFTQQNLVKFLLSIVGRIQKELKPAKATLSVKTGVKKRKVAGNLKVNKCWNTIRFIAEHDYFASHFLPIVEETLLPLFEYMVEPRAIDFDDDVVFCLSSLLKKGRYASTILRKVFPFLRHFQEKYKGIFGNLLQALNLYIVHGRDMFTDDPEARTNLGYLYEMANRSLNRREPPVMLGNNMEGALLLQMMF